MPKASKSAIKSNKSPNLVTLIRIYLFYYNWVWIWQSCYYKHSRSYRCMAIHQNYALIVSISLKLKFSSYLFSAKLLHKINCWHASVVNLNYWKLFKSSAPNLNFESHIIKGKTAILSDKIRYKIYKLNICRIKVAIWFDQILKLIRLAIFSFA